jgi:short-subunit dehydrogenase
MRRQRAGLVVNVSSIAGLVPVPFQGLYSASKAALESLTEAMRMEVQPFGVRVALIEPGDFSTGFTASRIRVAGANAVSPYRDRFERALAVMERDERRGPPPARDRPPARTRRSRAPRRPALLGRRAPSSARPRHCARCSPPVYTSGS